MMAAAAAGAAEAAVAGAVQAVASLEKRIVREEELEWEGEGRERIREKEDGKAGRGHDVRAEKTIAAHAHTFANGGGVSATCLSMRLGTVVCGFEGGEVTVWRAPRRRIAAAALSPSSASAAGPNPLEVWAPEMRREERSGTKGDSGPKQRQQQQQQQQQQHQQKQQHGTQQETQQDQQSLTVPASPSSSSWFGGISRAFAGLGASATKAANGGGGMGIPGMGRNRPFVYGDASSASGLRLCGGHATAAVRAVAIVRGAEGEERRRVASAGAGAGVVRLWDIKAPAYAGSLPPSHSDDDGGWLSGSLSPSSSPMKARKEKEKKKTGNLRGYNGGTEAGGKGSVDCDCEMGISCMSAPPHLDCLATGAEDGTVAVWQLRQRGAGRGASAGLLLGHTARVTACTFAGAGSGIGDGDSLLYSTSEDGTCRVWDLRSMSCVHVLKGHEGAVLCLCAGHGAGAVAEGKSGKGSDPFTVITGGSDGTVRVWDMRAGPGGAERLRLRGHRGEVTCLAWDWAKLVSGSTDATARVWDIGEDSASSSAEEGEGRCLVTCRGHLAGISCLLATEHFVATGSYDSTVRLWHL